MPSEEIKLKQFLNKAKYRYHDATKVDVLSVTNQYLGLQVKEGTFVFDNGAQKELIQLTGTIPVSYKEFSNGTKKQLVSLIGTIPVRYKGNVYNIPICIWLMDTHPYNAPICYVQPTADMQIKVSKYVDHNGKIYLPYLHDWEPNSYNLLGVVQVMIMVFGEQPPVYAKPKDPPANPASPYPVQPPSMPMPGGRPNSTGYPPYPLYPGASNPPYPAMPASGNFPPSSYPPTSTGSPYPPYYPNQGSGGAGYPPYPTGTAQPPPSGSFPPYAATGYPPTASATATGSASTGGSGTITEEHIRASLLSAVEDKLRRRMREQYSQGTAELETLRRTNQELLTGKAKLETLMSRLDREAADLDKSITVLQEKETELDKGLSRLAEQDPINVDEAVTTTAPLYKQLLNAFAEESATEDAIYYLGEALRKGVIELEVFLKQVRTLSRKQFMLRALMHKCRQKAGLAG